MSIPTFVLTVDAASARLFRVEGESLRNNPPLAEVTSLTRPEARMPIADRFSDSTPTGGVGGGGAGYHTFDDNRQDHEQEDRRRFAKQIAMALSDAAQSSGQVVICVTHSMQSLLAEALERHCRKLQPTWQTVEYTRLTPHELSKALSERLAKAAN